MKYKLTANSLILLGILLLAFVIRVSFAAAFPNILWPDEIFQTLEQGHRLAFNYGIIPWEFRDGIRSWVFPGVIGGIMKVTGMMGEGSDGYIAGVRWFLCLLSLIPVWVGFAIGYKVGGRSTAIITATIAAIWFELIYFAPKALSEVVSGYFLLAAVYFGFYNSSFKDRTRLILTGCLLGITLVLRIQLLLAVGFAIFWLAKKEGRKILLPVVLAALVPLLMAGILDLITWTYPFQSLWKNFWVNLIEKKAEFWGVSPWYEYLNIILRSWSIAVLPIAFLAVIGSRKSPILAMLALIILATHSIIGHKEYRFIYPLIPMVIILAGLGTSELINQLLSRRSSISKNKNIIIIGFTLGIWLFTSIILGRVYDTYQPFKSSRLWGDPGVTHWMQQSGNIKSFAYLSKEQSLCGVGLKGIDWWWSGGYAYLHQNIPIFLIKDDTELKKLEPNFNLLVSSSPSVNPDYQLEKCWGNICAYKRPGSCSIISDYHINKYLEKTGQ